MTDYKPGTVAVANVNSADNVTVMRIGRYAQNDFRWVTPTGYVAKDAEVADVRPLVVLDLDGHSNLAGLLRFTASTLDDGRSGYEREASQLAALADQIEEAKPGPRIPEPGLFGVVEGWQHGEHPHTDLSAFYLREATDGEEDWTRTSDGKRFEWDDITRPILVREGI